jgi:NADH dehydrogenase/NADH:ubiquinone oxidoreductase subunit G
MKTVRITLDGEPREASEGTTVLAVARAAGVDVPTLCHHEALGPYGACRLCVVEAEGPALRRSLVTSCTLVVSEGLSVATGSPAVRRARRLVLELLLGRAPGSEPIRALARRHGVEATRFGLGAEHDDCVRCGLCVRACHDHVGRAAIAFAGRGQTRRVTAEFGKTSQLCVGCGACAALCPTGAIRVVDEDGWRSITMRDLLLARLPLQRCVACGAPFATGEHLAQVATRLRDLPQVASAGRCPACARRERAAALAEQLAGG